VDDFSELNRPVWFSPEPEKVYFIYRGKRNQTGRRVADFVDDRSRRKEEVEEPLSMDEPAEKSRQKMGEDHQGHKAGNHYRNLQEYLHRSIVEGRGDFFAPSFCLRRWSRCRIAGAAEPFHR
jgi:hypothetical protein